MWPLVGGAIIACFFLVLREARRKRRRETQMEAERQRRELAERQRRELGEEPVRLEPVATNVAVEGAETER